MLAEKVIRDIEQEIDFLWQEAKREVEEVYRYLALNRANTKLRPRLKRNQGYSTFSIVWCRLLFFDQRNQRSKTLGIRKGHGHIVSKARLLAYCRDCEAWEKEYLWEAEQRFARIRKQVDLLSKARTFLGQYFKGSNESLDQEDQEDCWRVASKYAIQ